MKNEVFNLNPFAKSALGNFMKAACCFLLFVIVSVQWAGASENGLQISQQNKRTITGTVTDKSGEAIIGANIVEVGTTNGTVTDLNGHYTLAVLPDATLKISYIGYVEKTVKVGKSSTIDIVLAEDSKTLAEVVVVGYGTMDKKELTSAISHVSNKDFLGVASIDPSMQIQGKVPGLTITNTAMGDPNSGATIQIRGISSRSAGLGPLIVIDGVPGGNLHNINSNDIESIDVLKDGAASAIYGTRGSNGVIVITTKKGTTDGKVRTEYNGYVSFDFAHNDLDILTADEFRKYKVDTGAATDFGANTDWMDEITRTGFSQNHTLALSGGNSKTNYRISVDVRDAKGIDIRTDRTDYGARLGFEHTTNGGLFKFSGNLTPLAG